MSNPGDWTVITRGLGPYATPADRAALATWVAAHPEHRALVDSLRTMAQVSADQPLAPVDVPRALGALHSRIDRAGAKAAIPLRAGRGATGSRRRIIVGAVIAATCVIAASLSVGRRFGVRSGEESFREFASAPGSRTTVALRDGTQLVLGPASHLRVPSDFGRSGRGVELDGEALFTVVHDAVHPFTVHTARTTITDIGTQFDVRAYADDPATRIAVTEGRVDLRTRRGRPLATHGAVGADESRGAALADDSGALTAGDVAMVLDSTVSITRRANVTDLTAWSQGRLVFDNTPLQDVMTDLARTFDLEITVSDSTLLARHFTASFGEESADDVLKVVVFAMGASYTRSGRHVMIRRQSGPVDRRIPGVPAPAALTDRTPAAR